jgi:DNA helicase HerA-like ATPase
MTPRDRSPIGYIVQVDGLRVTLNLLDNLRGQVAAHGSGTSQVTEIGGLLGIDGGQKIVVLRITGFSFAEPKAVHESTRVSAHDEREPLRFVDGYTVGRLEVADQTRRFIADNLTTPVLGAAVFPLSSSESSIVVGANVDRGPLLLGTELRSSATLRVGLNDFLGRHVAVLGASGQGKSCFTASILQQIAEFPKARIVVFDINGEYARAFCKSEEAIKNDDMAPRIAENYLKLSQIGEVAGGAGSFKIPYYALGRQGLFRLLMPSDKTQRPALAFALEKLKYVTWDGRTGGVAVGDGDPVLFSDCRTTGAREALNAITELREGDNLEVVESWPHMSALAAIVAESHSVIQGKYAPERSAFHYSNVARLITRIERFIDDPLFRSVVDVEGGTAFGVTDGGLDWQAASEKLVERVFGGTGDEWRVHIVNMRRLPHDLMPFILGALLELYAHVLFRRGQGKSKPTLLVLEEAHHYLRPLSDEPGQSSPVAYERLAKEGRKFGLSLWLSTQRPSEVSPTVLAQCNNWIAFRLNSEQDQKMILNASEWADTREVRRLSALPRQHALIFGGAVQIPVFIRAPIADPTPESQDGEFDAWADSGPTKHDQASSHT